MAKKIIAILIILLISNFSHAAPDRESNTIDAPPVVLYGKDSDGVLRAIKTGTNGALEGIGASGGILETSAIWSTGITSGPLNSQNSNNPATYNGNQYTALWDSNSKLVLCKRATDAIAWSCVNYNGTPNDATFTGSGLNDLTSGGTATAGITATSTYEVEIDATGTPDTFKWRLNGGAYTSGVSITGSAQTLSNGITVTFGATTGHTLGNSWSIRVHPSISTDGDVHEGAGIGFDSTGILHINYGTYVTAGSLDYRRSQNAESIDGITADQSIDTGTGCGDGGESGSAQTCDTQMSYLVFFNDLNGGLYATFRSNGVSGDADSFIWKYNTGTTSWARATGTDSTAKASGRFIGGNADNRNAYVSHPYVDSNNKAHFVWTWRGTCGSDACEKGLSHVAYDMTNGDFEKADGSAQTIQIRYSNDDSIDTTGEDGTDSSLEGMQYRHPIAFDSDGNLNVVYGKADSNGNHQIYRKYHNGTSWSSAQQLTTTADPERVSDYPNEHFATLLVEGSKNYILYVSRTDGSGINVLETSDWSTFKKYAISNNNSGTYNPGGYSLQSIDWPAWEEDNNFYMVYQNNWYIYAAEFETETRSPIFILKWDPSSGAGVRQQQSYGMVNIDDLVLGSIDGAVRPFGTIKEEKQNVWKLKDTDLINDYTATGGKAANGDVVELAAGTYTITAAITFARQVHLKGQGGKAQGCKTTISSSTSALSLLNITSSNVSISDLCISNTGAGSSNGILVSGTGSTVLTNVNIWNTDVVMSGTGTQVCYKVNDANVLVYDVTGTCTSSNGTALGIYTFSASTTEAAYTVDVRNATITTSCGGGSGTSNAFGSEESSASQDSILNVRFSKGTANETGSCNSRGASANLGNNGILTIENSIVSGADADLFQASSATLTAKNVSLVNGTTSGTITWSGTQGANNQTLAGDLTGDGGDQFVGFLSNQVASTTTSLTAAQCGSTIVYDSADVMTLPEASTVLGCRYTFIVNSVNNCDINPADASDQIVLLTNAAGDAIRADAVGESITLEAIGANSWAPVGQQQGTWTDID